jgi:hypothetical protein
MNNYYSNVFRQNTPRPNQELYTIGKPIKTPYGVGIITDLKRNDGGLEVYNDSGGLRYIVISVLIPGQKRSIDFVTTDWLYQSYSGGQITPRQLQN